MSEKTKMLSNKLLKEMNIIKEEEKSLNQKRKRTEETKDELRKIKEEKEKIKLKESKEAELIEEQNLNVYQDENEYDEIIKI